jgi:hypothetical protein
VEHESILAFQKVSHLLPAEVQIILESRVEESEIDEEIETALDALNQPAREGHDFQNILSFRAEKDYPRSG